MLGKWQHCCRLMTFFHAFSLHAGVCACGGQINVTAALRPVKSVVYCFFLPSNFSFSVVQVPVRMAVRSV